MEDFGERNLPSRLVLNDAVKTLYFMQIPRQAMVCQSLTLSLIQLSDTLPLREKKDQIKSRGKIRPHTKLNLISLPPLFHFPSVNIERTFHSINVQRRKKRRFNYRQSFKQRKDRFCFFSLRF